MSTTFKKVFEPGYIGKLKIKNRIVMAPIGTRFPVGEGFMTDHDVEYVAARARGGAGMVVMEATYPSSYGVSRRPCLNDDKFIPGLRKIVDAIHDGGAKASIQLSAHMGRRDKIYAVSASGLRNPVYGNESHKLSVEEIKKTIQEYGEGVRRAAEAGFDSIMIHGGHGYLIQDFFSPLTNLRTDEYGGSLEKRARFVLEIVAIARKKTGPDYPLLIRIPGDERSEGGNGLKEMITIAKMLKEAGIDAIDVTSGSLEHDEWVSPSMYLPAAANVPLAQAIKEEVKITVLVPGKLKDPYLMEQILEEGKTDFVDLGRALLADPEFPNKMMAGKIEDIRPCISCLKCNESIWKEQPVSCSVNPALGKEQEFTQKLNTTGKKKRVLIIGGGPGGMQSALIAAQRGHDVNLWEKSPRLGGQLHIAIKPPHKEEIGAYLEYLIYQTGKAKIKVALNQEATIENIRELAPDAVILATGAKPLVPRIKGVDLKNVSTYHEVLTEKIKPQGKVVIIGGGFIGCETALFLAEKDCQVTIVEIMEEIAADVYHRIQGHLRKNVSEKGIKTYTDVKEDEIVANGVRIKDKNDKEVFLEADSVVLACGCVPDETLFQNLRGKVPEIYQIGDCVQARNIIEATREGAEAALNL
ncbi:FAD-dependent oxidoreductase [Chloroflexota bacterium]